MNKTDILIIGGGLTGLTLAYLLKDKNIDVKIIEARDRLGGRILTSYKDGSAPIEKGATWISKSHNSLIHLLQELNIETFEQVFGNTAIYEPISTRRHQIVQLPENNEPSYRIKGGTSVLIDRLARFINSEKIYLNQIVTTIEDTLEGVIIKTNTDRFNAKMVVSTLPPNLFNTTIKVTPKLPKSFHEIAQNTHTWMGESIKIGLRFNSPFWKNKNSSGTIFSNVGPIPEMYDHSNFENSSYALKGFLNGSYYALSKSERLQLVLKQLRKYYGNDIDKHTAYEELVWQQEKFTFTDYKTPILPHQNNGHAIFKTKFLNGKLLIGGAETASEFPGYMEGAVRSSHYLFKQLFSNKK